MAEEAWVEEEAQAEEQERQEEEDNQLRPVPSSMVAEVGYDKENEELIVIFNNGHEDTYPITPEQWADLKLAPSVGKWMWANVL